MLDRLLNTTIDLLIPTLFFAFTWWIGRLYELTYEGNIDRLPGWMQVWSKSLVMAKKPAGKSWRWLPGGLLLAYYAVYNVTYSETLFLIRLVATTIGLAIFGACAYYCDKKMGK